MKFNLNISSIWEYGQRKDEAGNPHQEDSLYPEFGRGSGGDRFFLICDGMGGHEAGEVASEAVCSAMAKSILASDPEGSFPVALFSKALDSAFKALDKIDSASSKKPGTTMAMLKLHADGATIAHIGDSRVYHIRPGKTASDTRILFMTSDHSLVNELVKIGELTPEQARVSPQRNVITRAMQPNMPTRPEADLYATSDIRPGDYFYLCSDGMLEQMDDASLREIFSQAGGSITKKTEILTRATEKNSDNHTAILVEVTDVKADSARPATSILTDEMSRDAREVQRKLAEGKVAESVGIMDNTPTVEADDNKKTKKPANLWPWVFIVAIVAAALVWIFCFRDSGKPAEEIIEQESTNVVIEQEQPADQPEYTEVKSQEATPTPGTREAAEPKQVTDQPAPREEPVPTTVTPEPSLPKKDPNKNASGSGSESNGELKSGAEKERDHKPASPPAGNGNQTGNPQQRVVIII